MFAFSLATNKPSRRTQVFAVCAVGLLAFAFLVVLPLSPIRLPRSSAFIPLVMGAIVVMNLVTAALLVDDFLRSRGAVLLLVQGYLFSGLIVLPYALSFPWALSADYQFVFGGLQTTIWLYSFWHVTFSASVCAYALLKDARVQFPRPRVSLAVSTSLCCMMVTLVLAISANADRWLPEMSLDEIAVTHRVRLISIACSAAAAVPLVILWLRRRSTLDVWLMVAMSAAVMEPLMIGLLASERYAVGFYVSRLFSVVFSAVILVALLVETRFLYWRNAELASRLQREQHAKLLSIDAVLGSIVHELRQPVAAITFSTDALRVIMDSDLRVQNFEADAILQAILRDTSRMGTLLTEIRGWVRSGDAAPEPVDVNEVVHQCLAIEQRALDADAVTVSMQLAPNLPRAACKPILLTHVLLNLIQNANDAMRASQKGARRLEIATGPSEHGKIAITVEDTGGGIDASKAEELFEPFVTRKPTGTGLGLPISRMIVDRFGGSLSVANGKHGAIFQVVLPVWNEAAP